MRIALAMIATLGTGCLVSAPDGAEQLWPPGLGGTVEAVVAGDLDANGSTDVVVIESGTESQNGMYLLRGGADFDFGATRPVRSFSRFVPTEWSAPIAATYVAGVAPQLYVAHSESTIELAQLSNTLAEQASGASTIAGGSMPLWTRPVTFPGNMVHPTVGNAGSIEHFATGLTEPRPIPPTNSPTWDGAQLATSYVAGSDQIVVVATGTQIQRAVLPTTPGAAFSYEIVRDGAAWSGQTTFDFDGDGRDEIVGLDLAAHKLCVVDPGTAVVPVTPSCIQLMSTFPGEDVTILVGQNLSMNVGLDILVAQASGSETSYTLVEDYTYLAGAIAASTTRTIPVSGPARGRTVLVNSGTATPFAALTFGTDATAFCAVGPC
jgi:hypothetical protein